MSETQIYLDLSEEVQYLLATNRIDIRELLQRENIEAKITQGIMPPTSDEEARSRDIVTIILVSSAAVMAVGWAISQVIEAISTRPSVVEWDELQELRDGEGNIIKDSNGEPIWKRTKKYQLIQPDKPDKEFNWEGKVGPVVLKISSQQKQTN